MGRRAGAMYRRERFIGERVRTFDVDRSRILRSWMR